MRIITPSDSDYQDYSKDTNGRIASSPALIFVCSDSNDVEAGIKQIRERNQHFNIASGHHSYEGFSTNVNGSVIDVSQMTDIHWDSDDQVTVGPGIQLIDLYESLATKRKTIPGGSCRSVAVSGLSLGGGFGLISRNFGMTCDSLTGLSIVDACGKSLNCSASENPDLFWACRGAGVGNFGVVTALHFKLSEVSTVAIFNLSWDWKLLPQVLKAWQSWCWQTDRRITSILKLGSQSGNTLSCIGLFLGSGSELKPLIDDFIKSCPKAIKSSILDTTYINAIRRFAGPANPKKSLSSNARTWMIHHLAASSDRFKNTSHYLYDYLEDEGIQTIIHFLSTSPVQGALLQLDAYGGAVADLENTDTAFPHRKGAKASLQYQIYWENPAYDERCTTWVKSFRKEMSAYLSGAYANYCDIEISDWMNEYFGPNVERLCKIKKQYDPDNFFQYPQSIPISK